MTVGPFTAAQLLSIPMIVIGVFFIVRSMKRGTHTTAAEA
jgi:prolipoprotein diacylglyceryltransferase